MNYIRIENLEQHKQFIQFCKITCFEKYLGKWFLNKSYRNLLLKYVLWKEKIDSLAITISHNHTINDNDKKNFQWSYDDWNLTSMYNNLTHAVYLKSQTLLANVKMVFSWWGTEEVHHLLGHMLNATLIINIIVI